MQRNASPAPDQPDGFLTRADLANGSYDVIRVDMPFRYVEPPPCHLKPEGRWVRAGKFPHYRAGYQLSFWGDGQLNFLFLTEIQPTVVRIRARPEFVEWHDGTKLREHAPDFEVRTQMGDVYVDIEPDTRFSHPSTAVRTASLTNDLAARGIRYRCLRAEPLGAQPRLDRAKLLNSFGRSRLPELDLRAIFRAVPDGGATAQEVSTACGIETKLCLGGLLHHVWHGRLVLEGQGRTGFSSRFRRCRR
ncbi:hypothetical protein [Mesorhizobium sp. M1B.F.Ca.ET.045.04.1.1]|uniref:hypothetical protein n=1 Tax=Mesorhizobium sp. M1B.F.Ca.ET.045.04.1.1 TaxID=2493673 RepID=UPI000F7513CE|nr:hypothetical protein [Mesorhizobium sp. M1B.F.Ca.ET.045.04.1.1]AZO32510.1 hypothetical protein EJ071_37830 [Mesorhizobium sp. M1B.F.Ca.ET.045.04.1.1]